MLCPSSLLLAPSGDQQYDMSIGQGARKRQHKQSKRAGRVQTDTNERSSQAFSVTETGIRKGVLNRFMSDSAFGECLQAFLHCQHQVR